MMQNPLQVACMLLSLAACAPNANIELEIASLRVAGFLETAGIT